MDDDKRDGRSHFAPYLESSDLSLFGILEVHTIIRCVNIGWLVGGLSETGVVLALMVIEEKREVCKSLRKILKFLSSLVLRP